ncbi:hypothetical protein AKJ59_00525 [candidate division MSBL1 archaeon SCGC-AAA385M02]|uniref:Uncharacterized protein n=1 Tax=candidate division MSBL1 archaeon SCGC-AAA385M02 TaxID=1698287 RepID=A0A133VQU2_9EURY|nr:hypothetical protein AKJ59_00525 [candidate division MSBL1 archaeon SCGC-AAA385M02]
MGNRREATYSLTGKFQFMECEYCGQKFAVMVVNQHNEDSTYDYTQHGKYYLWMITGAKYCPFCGKEVSWDNSSKQTIKRGE